DADYAYDEFKKAEVYLHQYSNVDPRDPRSVGTTGMADVMAPTKFRNGWQSVLRHVTANGFGPKQLTSEQIWLMMEDIWIQRGLLDALRSVNTQMAAFTLDQDKANELLHRTFRNRTWEIELWVKTEGTKRTLVGKLTNLTDRLQLLGEKNTMTLN